jgi:hypothetical protein
VKTSLALALLGLSSLTACGGSTPSNDTTPDASAPRDGGSGDASNADASVADAADETDAPDYGPYPAPHYPLPLLTNLGGPVQTAPHVYTVTFGTDAMAAQYLAFDDSIVTTPWWTTVTAGFGIGPGTSGGAIALPDTVSNATLDGDADIIPMVQSLVAAGTFPSSDVNALYTLYFPSSTTILLDGAQSCSGFGAYHDSAPVTTDAGVAYVAFAVIPDCNGFDTDAVAHEIIEAATDPHPADSPTPATASTWYLYDDAWTFGPGGGEAADMCEARGPTTQGTNAVPKVWNNVAAMGSHDPCVPQNVGEIFYSAAVPTQVLTNLPDPTGGGGPNYDSDGFIVMQPGTSKDVDVVVFSEAPLPHDVALVVGSEQQGETDPMDLAPVGTGITATLSQATGHNGSHVTLTLTIDSTVATGDYWFVVRAILDDATVDYHSWPVDLRIVGQ